MGVYVSTGAFQTKDINAILEIADRYDIRYLELAPGLNYNEDIINIILAASGLFHFLIHNYFPTPEEPFALNLASTDKNIIDKSLNMVLNNIDLTAGLGASHYSLHCGFCFDTDGSALGSEKQTELKMNPYTEAKEIFVRNIKYICEYAERKDIRIAIENNVLAGFAKDKENYLLGVTDTDIKEILSAVDKKNLGVLFDLAHAKVSCQSLGRDLSKMAEELSNSIIEIHISENDGVTDQNLMLNRDSETVSYIRGCRHVPVTLEVYDITPEQIKEQIALVEEQIEGI